VSVLIALPAEWASPLELYGCKTEFHVYDPAQAKNDLVLGVIPGREGIVLGLTYCTDILTETTVARMTANLTSLLAAVAADPYTPISRLQDAMDADERRRLLGSFQGDVHEEYLQQPMVAAAFEAAAAKQPQAACVAFEGSSMTYAQVGNNSTTVMHYRVFANGRRQPCGPCVICWHIICLECVE
jgi:non-ribosomal peptide synthetase component F